MKKEKNPKKKTRIPTIKIPSIYRMKLALAIIMLAAEILAVIGSSIYGFQMGAVSLVLFAIVTYDYIRILRAEEKGGSWYELDNIEEQ